jgi:hypothetical protein
MALFPQVNTYFMGRTNTSLVVSEGNAPAEKYIPSANEKVKFQYHFGPEGNQNVVIPKGKAVAIAGMEWDIETEHYVPALKIADGTTDTAIGINHHNVYERIRDRFSGNQPTVITREYIELPLFPSKSYANAIKFGAAWVEIGAGSPKPIDYANAIIGKKIAVDEHGNLTVANETYKDVIGTCYGVETDVPPAGYLQYFMEMDDQRWAEFVKQMSYAPSMGRTKDADWNDIGTYPLGTGYLKSKEDLMKNFRAGIPFLTDGYFRARTEKTYTLETTGVDVKIAGHITISEDAEDSNKKKITCSDYVGAALFIRLPDKLAMDAMKTGMDAGPEFANGPQPGAFSVKIGNTTVSEANYHIDYTNNMVVIYLTQAVENQPIEIKAVVLENQIPGIPTGWDFKYALGGVRILLQR